MKAPTRSKRAIDPKERRHSIKEAAPILKLHPDTVKLKCASGAILATKPGRKWEIPESAVTAYLSGKTVAVSQHAQ